MQIESLIRTKNRTPKNERETMYIRMHPYGCGRMHIIDYRNQNSIYSVQQTQDKYQVFFGISGIFVCIYSFISNNVRKRVTAFRGYPYFYPYAPTALINCSIRSALSYFIFSVTCPYTSNVNAAVAWPKFS